MREVGRREGGWGTVVPDEVHTYMYVHVLIHKQM